MDIKDNEMNEMLTESFLGNIGQKIRQKKDDNSASKMWNNSKGKMKHSVFHSTKVTDKDFNDIVECFNKLKTSKNYNEYKKWFDKMCGMCKIPIEGCIIQHYSFKRGKNNKNEVCITYSNTRHKIFIPSGSALYHNSTSHDIKELKPVYQGKAARGFLYSTPRVYLTIREKYPKRYVDLKNNEKTTLYRVKENISSAYIDPLVPGYKFGAVYVETKFPIPVEKVKSEVPDKKVIKEYVNEEINDMDSNEIMEFVEMDVPTFTSLEEFVEYYGLELIDDVDVIQESFSAKIGQAQRKIKDDGFIKKTWKELASKISHDDITKEISFSDYEKLNKNYNILKSSNQYNEYKRAYEYICKYFGLQPEITTIRELKFENNNKDKKKVTIKYHVGKKKIMIPNGVSLIHTSSKPDIKELIPSFCSKKRGMFMWPTRRVYFTLGKAIDQKKVGVDKKTSSYKYTPKETFKTAYIDSELPSFNMACVYVDTQFPIPVRNITKEAEDTGILKSLQKKVNG